MPNANAAKFGLQAALPCQCQNFDRTAGQFLTINVVTPRLRKVVRQLGCAYPQESTGEPVRTT